VSAEFMEGEKKYRKYRKYIFKARHNMKPVSDPQRRTLSCKADQAYAEQL
jgi:hypothetical protein